MAQEVFIKNREDAIEELRKWQKSDDEEAAHINADGVLCDLLISLGYEDVVNEWEKVDKWYS